jgi:phage terminase large subunit-like protein
MALRRNKVRTYAPYPKQLLYHNLGAQFRERCLLAANQSGKSLSAAAEIYFHLSGKYPDWWEGRRFPGPTSWWISNSSFEQVRDNGQRLLMGEGGQEVFGTGIIPKREILDWTMSRSTSDCVDTCWIAHVSGGRSYFKTKAYEQGRLKWQGWTGHGIWLDEEPPTDIYSEALTRLAVRQGLLMLTATPLMGPTEVVGYFYPHPNTESRAFIGMTLDECGHYTDQERRDLIAGWPEHEREARGAGLPMMGEGIIFPVAESVFVIDPIEIPGWWPQLAGLDFGYDHPTAAAQLAFDPDHDRVYVTRDYARKGDMPREHAMTLSAWGDWLRFSWPHDGNRIEDKESDRSTAQMYRDLNLRLLPEHATFPDGSVGVMAGNNQILDRMRTDRWKVFSTCNNWRRERRGYYMENGKPVPKNDDTICASRYAYMMRRAARPKVSPKDPYPDTIGTDYNPMRPRDGASGFDPRARQAEYNPLGGT